MKLYTYECRMKVLQEALALHPARKVVRGDIIVYYLTEWQRRQHKQLSGHHQYSSSWSLPQVVTEAEGHRVFCRPVGSKNATPRQVPLRLVRLLRSAHRAGEGREGGREEEETGVPVVMIPISS
eukprot:GHVS01023979.1.p2 GENE.GHVS01023979.1~~GHVS01023979.1.p2  ORF type:complete len:124 (-),score=16.43 GHVS01023979.1:153-524(-)